MWYGKESCTNTIKEPSNYSRNSIKIRHVRRSVNAQAAALAGLAASLTLPPERQVNITVGERRVLQSLTQFPEFEQAITTVDITEDDWRYPYVEYHQHGRLPADRAKRAEVRRRAPRFVLDFD